MYGAKLYGRNVEPVLEVYTEYLGDKAMLGVPVTALEYRPVSVLVEADIVKCQ